MASFHNVLFGVGSRTQEETPSIVEVLITFRQVMLAKSIFLRRMSCQLPALSTTSGHTIHRIIYGLSNEGQNRDQATSLLDQCWVRARGSCRTSLWYSLVLASDESSFVVD